ncbi:hypothetical protein WJU16_03010 [Chitinophaga pollutisoli]|uniref:Tetratricopeptide repeat protein n=1 Tax=Chitinophaga pollutisoli TaxID=3133966 RepID=A0ABZ2YRX6_9BACT
MAIYFEQTNRLIIPRWRKFNPKCITAEHKLLTPEIDIKSEPASLLSFNKKEKDWHVHGSVGHAWELVHSAYINQEFSKAKNAAAFLKDNLSQISPALRKVINEILGEDISEPNSVAPDIIPINKLTEITRREIKSTKRKISYYLRNEFQWLELSRLYSIIGELEKAKQCINIAIYFSNNQNRYFLRSASRFFYHIGNFEQAQSIIRRSPHLKSDPWLLSTDISYSNKMERHAVNAKRGREIVDSKNFSNESITELAGVLGTMELKNDSVKNARKLTKQSLLAPNDNSLAQAEWIAHEISEISIEPWLNKMELGFEARTLEFLHNRNYAKCLHESLLWVMDQPFSKRACHFVSYLCTGLTENYETAIEVGELGAKTNWDYFPIINNLTFAHISAGNLTRAKELLEHMTTMSMSSREQCFALATVGYYYYRSKEYVAGRESYQKAIDLAAKNNYDDLKKLATANLLREGYLAGESQYVIVMAALEKISKDGEDLNLEEQIKHIITSVKKEHEVKNV